MKVFWVNFKQEAGNELPIGTWMGCGVTAYDKDDALKMLKEKIFFDWELIPIASIKENISIEDLDQNHVVPNIGNFFMRGIWFPNIGS